MSRQLLQVLAESLNQAVELSAFGWDWRVVLPETDSTQEVAWAHAAQCDAGSGGGVVVALRQTAGRGRLGRVWASPEGNVYLSVLSRRLEPPMRSPGWAPVAGLAVATVLAGLGVETRVKWPNDVWVGGRKVCGILSEARGPWRVTGIGINANTTVADLPEEVRATATTLRDETGGPVDTALLLRNLLLELGTRERAYLADECRVPVEEYRSRMLWLGDEVRVTLSGGDLVAVVEGIREDGALCVRTAKGALEAVLVGEVMHVRPAGA